MDETPTTNVEIVPTTADAWADRLNTEWRATVEGIIGVGKSLIDAKAALPHGQFGRLFKDSNDPVAVPFVLSNRSSRVLIDIASNSVLTNRQYIADLPPSWGTLGNIARLDDSVIVEAIDDGRIHTAMTQKDAGVLVAKVRFEERKQRFHDEAASEGERWVMLHDDFRNVTFDQPIDAIITDPPYPDEFLPLWGDLAEWAADVLRPGGVLAAWSGQKRLPEILEMMSKHLKYGWTMALDLPGAQSHFIDGNMFQTWKPIIIYVKDKWPPHDWGPDRVESPQRVKGQYEWQQHTQPAADIIERFVSPGGLVVDPFCGTGAFGVAALQTGRRFIGVEIDEERFAESKGMLATWEN